MSLLAEIPFTFIPENIFMLFVPSPMGNGSTFGLDYSYRHTNPFQGSHSIGARINL